MPAGRAGVLSGSAFAWVYFMKRVLHIGHCGYKYGTVVGGEIAKNRVIHRYLKDGYRVRLADMYSEVAIRSPKRSLGFAWMLLRILFFGFWADAIVVVSCYPKLMKVMDAVGLGKKAVFVAVGTDTGAIIKESKVGMDIWRSYRAIMVESIGIEKELKKMGLQRAKYVRNCKYLPRYDAPKPASGGKELHLFYIGQIRAEKGIGCLLEAMDIANKGRVRFILHLYGDVWDDCPLDGAPDYVVYEGIIDLLSSDENYGLLWENDIFVFPSEWKGEGLSGAVQDALALGKPIVASRHHMIMDMVEEGKNGFLFEKRNAGELAGLLMRFYDDRSLIEKMGAASLAMAEQFRAENVLEVFGEYI